MAVSPYRFVDRRGYRGGNGYGSNILLDSAQPTQERKVIPRLDVDFHRALSAEGRRLLVSLGRYIAGNMATVGGILREQTQYAAAAFAPQYRGDDQSWGDRAEAWLSNHHEICDIAGWPFGMRHYRRMIVAGVLRDGELGTLLTQRPGGYPQLQIIPAHRIGCSACETTVDYSRFRPAKAGETDSTGRPLPANAVLDYEGQLIGSYDWQGRTIIDGVIVDDYLTPLAYRVLAGSGLYTDISADDLYLTYSPEYPGQLRGVSVLGSSLFDWQDVQEFRRFELIAQKAGAAISLIERTETGEAQAGADWLQLQSGGAITSGNATGLTSEVLDGGTIRYLRANSGQQLEAFRQDRPTSAQMTFEDRIIRNAFYSLGWSVDYGLDPTRVGGAPMRVVVERINRAVANLQGELLRRACARYDGYALAKAMKLGLLPWNDQWYAWHYQAAAQLTADAKYQSDVDLQERHTGIKTLAKITAERGEDWLDVRRQREREADDLLERATRLAERWGLPLAQALSILELSTPNQSSTATTATNKDLSDDKRNGTGTNETEAGTD